MPTRIARTTARRDLDDGRSRGVMKRGNTTV